MANVVICLKCWPMANFKRAHGIAVGWVPNIDRYDRLVAGHIHVIAWHRAA